MKSIGASAFRHVLTGIMASLVVAIVVTGVGYVFQLNYLFMPILVTLAYSVSETTISTLLWRWIASNHPDSLPVFYTAASGFRMLIALVVLTAIYCVVGRDAMAPFVLVFMANYFVMLVVHSRFYTSQVKETR